MNGSVAEIAQKLKAEKNKIFEISRKEWQLCGVKNVSMKQKMKVVPTEIYWCKSCNIPVIRYKNDISKDICPLCNGKANYLSTDLRPVFPEERLLFELMLDKSLQYLDSSVWADNSRYYINGKFCQIP